MPRYLVNTIIVLLLLAIIIQAVRPAPAEAQFQFLGKFAGCLTAGFLSGLISEALNWVNRFLAWLFGIDFFNQEVPTSDGAIRGKESNADTIARCAAREVLSTMNNNILNIMRTSGRNGGAAFVRDWRNYQTNAQYRGENVFRAMLSSTNLCPHINENIRRIFNLPDQGQTLLPGQNGRVNDFDPYQLRANCTMPEGFDVEQFKQDAAANGGWEAFLRLQQPQNNPYLSLLSAMEEADTQRSLEQSNDIYETLGHGFTGKRNTVQNTNCLVMGLNGQCVVYRQIDTPGNTISGSTMETIAKELDFVVNTDEINELVAVAINALFSRLTNLGNPTDRLGNPGEPPLDVSDEIGRFLPSVSVTPPIATPTPSPTPSDEPSLTCIEQGLTDLYDVQVEVALNNVINNTTLDDGQRDNPNDVNAFMDAIVNELVGMGLRASRIQDGPTLRMDTVIVWMPGDPDGHIYDFIGSVGDPGRIGDYIMTRCVGHGDFSRARDPSGGGGGGGGNATLVSATNGHDDVATGDTTWADITMTNTGQSSWSLGTVSFNCSSSGSWSLANVGTEYITGSPIGPGQTGTLRALIRPITSGVPSGSSTFATYSCQLRQGATSFGPVVSGLGFNLTQP